MLTLSRTINPVIEGLMMPGMVPMVLEMPMSMAAYLMKKVHRMALP